MPASTHPPPGMWPRCYNGTHEDNQRISQFDKDNPLPLCPWHHETTTGALSGEPTAIPGAYPETTECFISQQQPEGAQD